MNFKIAVLKGDGIGPEIVDQSIKALKSIEKKYNHKFILTEALIGAVFLDKGYQRTQRFVINKIMKRYLDLDKIARKESDFKSRLIEWAQKNKHDIRFVSTEEENDGTEDYVFTSRVMITGQQLGFGKGLSKKDAEQQAAEQALDSVLE